MPAIETGSAGRVSGVFFLSFGHDVAGIDKDPMILNEWNKFSALELMQRAKTMKEPRMVEQRNLSTPFSP